MGKIYTYHFSGTSASKVWDSTNRFTEWAVSWAPLTKERYYLRWQLSSTNNGSIADNSVFNIYGCDIPIENSFYAIRTQGTSTPHIYALGMTGYDQRSTLTTSTARYSNSHPYDNPPLICKRPLNNTLRFGTMTGQNIGGGGAISTNFLLTLIFEEIDE